MRTLQKSTCSCSFSLFVGKISLGCSCLHFAEHITHQEQQNGGRWRTEVAEGPKTTSKKYQSLFFHSQQHTKKKYMIFSHVGK